METKNLDALMKQATKGPFQAGRADMATIVDGVESKWIYAGDNYIAAVSSVNTHDWNEVMANARMMALFATHGPALVAALKDILKTSQSASGDYVFARSDALKLLAQLDQEATT